MKKTQRVNRNLTSLYIAILLMALVAASIAYSAVLPVLPFLVEAFGGIRDNSLIATHTGFLTAAYTLAIALGAPLWGRIADHIGSKRVILIGLTGLGATLMIFPLFQNLYLAYVGRFLNGLFDSAIAPAAMLAISRYRASDAWKAQRLSWIGLASIIGALVGPTIGGIAVQLAKGSVWAEARLIVPFLVAAAITFLVAILILLAFPSRYTQEPANTVPETVETHPGIVLRLRMLAFIAAFSISAFEVLLTMHSKTVLGLDAYRIGLMFSECSLVMFLAQSIVFSPLVKPPITRYLIAPAFLLMIGGLWLIPFSGGFIPMLLSVGMVASGGGVVSPVLIYWISLIVRHRQGESLGKQVAAGSLGQATGAAISGLLFGFSAVFMPFIVVGLLVAAALALSLRLPGQLALFSTQVAGRHLINVKE